MLGEWSAPFANKGFRWLFIGQMVSALGDWCSYVVIPALLYHLTHEASSVAWLFTCRLVPQIVLAPYIGRWIARFSILNVMILADLVRGLGYVAMMMWHEAWVIYGLSLVISSGTAFFNPGKFTLIPALTTEVSLARANSYVAGVGQFMMLVGPAVGGAVFGLIGETAGLLFNALTFFFSMVALFLIRDVPKRTSIAEAHTSTARPVHTPVRYLGVIRSLNARRMLMAMVLGIAMSTIGFGGTLTVMFPVLAEQTFHGGQKMYGEIMSCLGGGIFLGTMVGPILQKWVRSDRLYGVATIAGATAVFLFGSTDAALAALFLIAAVGCANGVQDNAEITYLQKATKERGDTAELFSLQQALDSAMFVAATLFTGWLSGRIGAQETIRWMSVMPLVAGVAILFLTFWWQQEGKMLRIAKKEQGNR